MNDPYLRAPPEFLEFPLAEIQQSIATRFEAVVRRFPQRLAVRVGDQELTYEELNRKANRIAAGLLARFGDGAEPVALCLAQGMGMVAAILGVLKAGKYYAPLDPETLRTTLEELETRVLVTGEPWLAVAMAAAPAGVSVLSVEELEVAAGPGNPDPGNPGVSTHPEALAYVFFTSGSTGRPKGVVDSHRNVLHNILRYTNTLCFAPSDRFTLLQAPSFSGAVSSLFGALLNGASVFPFDLLDQGVGALVYLITRERITAYHSVPTIFRLIASHGRGFRDLRLIRLEGDRAAPKDVAMFQEHFASSCLLVNGLGATECGIVRQHFVGTHTPNSTVDGIVPIGLPVQDMEVVLVDPGGDGSPGKLVADGEVGEIEVSSAYLAVGYWRQPELTAHAFQEVPGQPGVRAYRTGDLGRLLADGRLLHLGRRDTRVKVRGLFVNLAELETELLRAVQATLAGASGITTKSPAAEADCQPEAVVLADVDDQGETRLTAYVVVGDRRALSLRELRTRLAVHVPTYWVPERIVFVEALPTTANGKVDRQALM